nr:UTRA domain-containing protein [Streptomyces sp. IB201691-2A2]
MPAPQDIVRRLGNQPGDPSVRTSYEFLADGTRTARGQLRALAITGGTPILLPEMGPLAGQGVVERMRSIGVNTEQWVEVPRPARVTPEQAALLGIGAGDLVLSVGRTYYDGDGRAVETADIIVPDDCWEVAYEFTVDLAGLTVHLRLHPGVRPWIARPK